jgi:von Willebrand factor type A domain
MQSALLPLLALAASAAVPQDDQIQTSPVIPVTPAAVETRAVDLAICLDTSGSMSGLIESAKQKLWAVVNDLALAEPQPVLRVALLTYGNDGHRAEDGWVKVDVPLTGDLDLVSKHLFALGTNGGTELVGRVIGKATGALDWSPDSMALKLIVVAGNESADQDQVVNFRDAAKAAITAGVMINSIYCGNPGDGIAPGWAEIAKLADGHYATIDHNQGMVVVETPFDVQLGALSVSVNATYLPVGSLGRAGWANQVAQDSNAAGLNSAAGATRAQTKGGKLYRKSWDLVEMAATEGFDWSKLKDEDLPAQLRPLDLAGRKAHVVKQRQQRELIHKQIAELSKQRGAWVQAYSQLNGLDGSRSFDQALRGAMRSQAEAKGFKYKVEQPVKLPTPEEVQAAIKAMGLNPVVAPAPVRSGNTQTIQGQTGQRSLRQQQQQQEEEKSSGPGQGSGGQG